MPKKVKYCVNHSNVAASDKCSECGKPLCYNCRLEFFERIYCSAQCITIFLSKGFVLGGFWLIKALIRMIQWPFRKLLHATPRGFAELVLCVGLAVCFFFVWKLQRQVRLLETGMEVKSAVVDLADTGRIVPPRIFEPTEGGMVHSNTLTVSGEVEENRMVSLSIDGELERVILPEGKAFSFDDIRLHRGQNRIDVRAIAEDGRVSILQSLLLTYASPTLSHLSRNLRRGPLERKHVALTFDGGSINNAAGEILDYLKEKNVQCTFFLTGGFIREYPETVRRLSAEGHEVGNHTWSHPHLTSFAENRRHEILEGVTAEMLKRELSRTASLFQVVTSREMAGLWRAPFGELNNEILRWAAEAGYKHVGWTVGSAEETMDTLDWVADKNSKVYRSADEIADRILRNARNGRNGANGAIILMHLGTHREDDFPHQKLPEIIDGLREQGYSLVRVSEMLADG